MEIMSARAERGKRFLLGLRIENNTANAID
jgi:hypothetical protein